MSGKDDHNEDDMEFLSRVIVNAIMQSEEVRKAIKMLTESDKTNQKSFMVLMLKVQHLLDSIDPDDKRITREIKLDLDEVEEQSEISKSSDNWKRKSRFIVDGKMETPQELAFRKFLSEKFNQREWLRSNGLNLD
ncbi:MAG TPA: hypothetical protein QF720_08180 [Nitrospinota bacterium]|nr:hypothetical protein [Nitrospinota bacterium]|tara:strand:+ start:158859 stop:159263 length:405 start_codon:yes stop_codon:yes gene_type:complete